MGEKKPRKRQEIPEEYKWRLSDLFESDHRWEEEIQRVHSLAQEIAACQGTLGESAQALLFLLGEKGMNCPMIWQEFMSMPMRAIIRI